MLFPGRNTLAAIVALGFGLSIGVPARADQVVYFVNGKAITAKKVEKGDRVTILEIEGGGRIGVPTVQIDRIEELLLSAPGPAVAIAAPVPAQPAPAPAQVTPAGQPAAVAAAAGGPLTGPGIGGKPALPAGSLTGLKPLTLGGEESDGPPIAKVAVPAHPGTQPAGALAAGPMPGMGPSGQTLRTDGGIVAGPGAAGARRFNARGGAFGRARPAAGSYYIPPAQGAPGQTQGAQGQPAAKPPAAQQPAGQSPQQPSAQPPQQPAAQTPPPPPPPIQEPPPPPPDDQGATDSSGSPPPDDPGTPDPPPADDNPPGGQT